MKHTQLSCLFIGAAMCLCAAFLVPSKSALGQDQQKTEQSAPVVIGIVDVDLIMRDSKVGKSIKTQFDQQKKAFGADVDKQRKAYEDSKQKLLNQKSSMSEADFKKKAEDLNKQADEAEKTLGQRQRKLETSAGKAQNQALQTMAQLVRELATARGMTLVITKSAAVVFDGKYEITAEVMQKLDAKMPSVKLQ